MKTRRTVVILLVIGLLVAAASVAIAAEHGKGRSKARHSDRRVTVTSQSDGAQEAHPDGDEEWNLDKLNQVALEYPDEFAGAFYDRDRGAVVIGVTTVKHASVWEDIVIPGHRVAVERAQFSLGDLHAVRDELLAELGSSTLIYTDVPGNVVVVGVKGAATGDLGRDIANRYGDMVRLEPPSDITDAACPQSDCSLAFQGGVRARSDNGYSCTTSWMFDGKRPTPQGEVPTEWLMTAGHCATAAGQGEVWRHPKTGTDVTYGPLEGEVASYGDVGVMDIEISATAKFWVAGEATPQRTVATIQAVADELIGQSVCASGASANDKYCGQLLAVDAYGPYRMTSIATCDTQVPNDCANNPGIRQGDSGGPVFFNYEARGLIKGWPTSGPNAGRMLYTQVKKARNIEGYNNGYHVVFDHYCTSSNPC